MCEQQWRRNLTLLIHHASSYVRQDRNVLANAEHEQEPTDVSIESAGYRGNGVPNEAKAVLAAITNSSTSASALPGVGRPSSSLTVRCFRSAPGSSTSAALLQNVLDSRATVLHGSISVTDASRCGVRAAVCSAVQPP